jgi:hypothetical protein
LSWIILNNFILPTPRTLSVLLLPLRLLLLLLPPLLRPPLFLLLQPLRLLPLLLLRPLLRLLPKALIPLLLLLLLHSHAVQPLGLRHHVPPLVVPLSLCGIGERRACQNHSCEQCHRDLPAMFFLGFHLKKHSCQLLIYMNAKISSTANSKRPLPSGEWPSGKIHQLGASCRIRAKTSQPVF